ncbi:hypothetical protein GCM10010967_09290 [Dyadobacter beijingensis]|uniref:Outer membrane protein beta-barrel domain-containing protein n=1 Tax=Dyadobacter beijingensis TaxID=365489 RepID=A0ABQ2HIS4_9BACT|nr:hypothetical protein GCM10010967_09290 [Dyadobacter beijingensis]
MLLPGMVFLAGRAEAQFQKGTVHWGATISAEGTLSNFETYESNRLKTGVHTITPSVQFGKFFKDNSLFGARLLSSFNYNKSDLKGPNSDNEYKNNNTNLSLSLFVRRYKFLGEKWAIFLEPGINLSYYHGKNTSDDVETSNGYGGGIYIRPGIVYRVSPRFAIESDLNVLSLNLQYYHMKDWDNFHFSAGATSGIQSYFGLRASWYLTQSN